MASLNGEVVLDPDDDESAHSPTISDLDPPSVPTTSAHGSCVLAHQSSGPNSTGLTQKSTRGPQCPLVSPQLTSGPSRRQKSPTSASEPDVNLASALAAFRRCKKAKYDELLREFRTRSFRDEVFSSGPLPVTPMPVSVEGHWKGDVQIVRDMASK